MRIQSKALARPARRRRLRRCIIMFALSVAWVAVVHATPASAATSATHPKAPPRVHTTPTQGAPLRSSASPLIDLGGRVMARSNLYAIWWGPRAKFPSDAVTETTMFLNGLNGSSYLQLASPYLRGARASTSSVTTLFDATTAPRTVSPATLGNEVNKLTHGAPDPAGIYLVFTTAFPTGAEFCAWHSATTIGDRRIAVAYLPNVALSPGCDPGDRVHASPVSAATRSLVNVTAHELLEAVTDPDPDANAAWKDALGAEIGDKCAWQFAAPVQLANGSRWQLQEEWSNATGRCEQG